jgi:peptide/nickel transport system substrate-binding protein
MTVLLHISAFFYHWRSIQGLGEHALRNRRIFLQMRSIFFALCSGIVVVACQGKRRTVAPVAGTVVIESAGEPNSLFPPAVTTLEGRQVTELVYEYLADVGPGMNTLGDAGFERQLAKSWGWSPDSMSISFSVDPAARWHDGYRVSAQDVAFTYAVYSDPRVGSPAAEDIAEIDSVVARDSLTAVFWFKRRTPHQFYDAAAQMLIIPAHLFEKASRDSLTAIAASMKPVGSGRYRFTRWDHGSRVEVEATPSHYRGTAGISRLIWLVAADYQTGVTRLIAGDIDVFPSLRSETLPRVLDSDNLELRTLPGMDYAFMAFNIRKQLFSSRNVRRAITMAIDRAAIVRNLFDTLASVPVGPTVRAFPSTDTTIRQLPYDLEAAKRLLDSAGWHERGQDGIRVRNGIPFRFHLLVPTSSQARMRASVLLQAQLRRAGIDVMIDQMDNNAVGERQSRHDFDAVLGAWHLGSSPSAVKSSWSSSALGKSGLNYGSYSNPDFDALVDSAMSVSDTAISRRYYTEAYQVIVDDAPAVWLYEPKTLLAVQRRLKITSMRPTAWWSDIARWKIDPGLALSRDSVPIRTK